jgi:hypothetical protein
MRIASAVSCLLISDKGLGSSTKELLFPSLIDLRAGHGFLEQHRIVVIV